MKLFISFGFLCIFLLFDHSESIAQSRVDFEWVCTQGAREYDLGGNDIFPVDSGKSIVLQNVNTGIRLQELSASGKPGKQKNIKGSIYYPYNSSFFTGKHIFLTGEDSHYGDAFVYKYDTDLNLIWDRRLGGKGHDNGWNITVDNDGNVLTSGRFTSTADFDPGPDSFLMSTSSKYDFQHFISKLDSTGNFVWAKQFSSSSTAKAGAASYGGGNIQTDDSGNVYVCHGFYRGTVDFDPGPGVFELTSNGDQDIFICKLSPKGEFVWAKQFGGSKHEWISDMKVTGSGDVYFTGVFSDWVDFDPGPGIEQRFGQDDIFVASLDRDGELRWVNTVRAWANRSRGYGLAISDDEHLYLTGALDNDAFFTTSNDTFTLPNSGYWQDVFIQKLTLDGHSVWAKRFGGDGDEWGTSVAIDDDNNVFVAGVFGSGTPLGIDFDFGPGKAMRYPVAIKSHSFVLKISQCNNDSAFSLTFCDSIVSPSGKYVWRVPGNYHDTIPNANGCDSILQVKLKRCPPVNISNVPVQDYSIYPNPTSGRLTIDLGNQQNSISVNIRSVDGRLVDAFAYRDVEKINMDVSHIPKGVYFLEINNGLLAKENFRVVKL